MVLLTIVGVRPQFIKAAALRRALHAGHREVLVHTGQHYDDGMSDVFFRTLDLPQPAYHLGVGSGSHAEQTARMLVGIEQVLLKERPDLVVVFGDTNSTLAGALAAAKLGVPVAHVEAGCRSYDRSMPEEINRLVTDQLSALLFCPTPGSVRNLEREGIVAGVHHVGDVMLDLLRANPVDAASAEIVLQSLGLARRGYALATVHRAANTNDPERLRAILDVLQRIDEPVIFPVHPRTKHEMDSLGLVPRGRLRVVDPVGYHEMLGLMQNARIVLTDSGGVQKEAYYLGTPCLTLRDSTEWPETVEAGWNRVVGLDQVAILESVQSWHPVSERSDAMFGGGRAAERMVRVLDEWMRRSSGTPDARSASSVIH